MLCNDRCTQCYKQQTQSMGKARSLTRSVGPISAVAFGRSEIYQGHRANEKKKPMVDRLRRSLDELEPPICAKCHIEMEWYRSVMVKPAPLTIDHFFSCPNCKRIREARQVLSRDAVTPPGKLSAPVSRFRCAA